MTAVTGLAPKRADELEHLLGSLSDPANPTGAAAVLAADERAEMLAAGESLLHSYGLNAEFVPPELGGRLERADHLAEVMRTLYRRDPALGLGYGASSLIAGVTVWSVGDPGQTEHAARLLLDGRRIAIAFHELAHGNDMAGMEFAATAAPDGMLRLSGQKEVVTNIGRADAMVVLARTDPRPGPRSHSLVLVDRASADPAYLTDLPRFDTVGMRGVQLGGLRFDELPVPVSAVLGPVGSGLETALKALQITRTVLPAMATGILDTGLRITVDHLTRRRLYGGPAIALPHVRSVLAGVFADLLRAEALGAVGARALHVVPGSASVYASAVKFEVSRLLLDAMDRLAELLGAHFYLREGPTALFQKLLRDLAPVGFGHIARAACQMSLLPQLPLLARRTWSRPGTEAPAGLYALTEALPPLPYDRLALHAAGRDPIAGSLPALLDAPWTPEHADLRAAVAADRADLTELAAECGQLSPVELGVDARPEHYDLVTRYVRLLSRTACVQVWRHARPEHFLADPAWLRAALHRSAPGGHRPAPLPAPVEDALLAELLDRRDTGRSFGLTGRPLAV
ncbi:acyl-CoA dehydrogenase [Streptomyces sp. NPDC054940]